MLRRFDCLRRVPRDISQGTLSGAVISIITLLMMTAIFYSQISMWLTPGYKRRTTVKRAAYDDFIPVDLNMTFISANCDKINFKIHDSFSVQTKDKTKHLNKVQRGESCRVHADFFVRKINGQFFFTATDEKTDLSHTFGGLTFGDYHPSANKPAFRALSGTSLRDIGASTHDYNLKLLLTEFYDHETEHELEYSRAYQYTFSYRPHVIKEKKEADKKEKKEADKKEKKEEKAKPHYIRFKYNWSPLSSEYTAEYSSVYYLLTNTIAYSGALFTTAGVLHRAYLGGASFVKRTIAAKKL